MQRPGDHTPPDRPLRDGNHALSRRDFLAFAAATAGLLSGCGGGGGAGGGTPSEAQQQVDALAAPGRSVGVESFTDNINFSVLAPVLYPEVQALIALGNAAADTLGAWLSDRKRDGTDDGDRTRALAAFVLEQTDAVSVIPALRDYVARASRQFDRLPFYSVQAATHALAVLTGQAALVKSLYSYDQVQAVLEGAGVRVSRPSASRGTVLTRPVRPTAAGRAIEHLHAVGPQVPPAWSTTEVHPLKAQNLKDTITTPLEPFSRFRDPVQLLSEPSHSFCCHSWALRREDTERPDLAERYHIYGESVPVVIEDEGYLDITEKPDRWRITDLIVFYKSSGGLPMHTGRLSFLGASLDDPNLRFTSKWSIVHPILNTSVRDCMMLYGRIVRIFANPVAVPITIK